MLFIDAVHTCQALIFLWFTRRADKHAMEANVIARENAENMTRIANETLALSSKQANNAGLMLGIMLMAVSILFCFTVSALAGMDETTTTKEAGDTTTPLVN